MLIKLLKGEANLIDLVYYLKFMFKVAQIKFKHIEVMVK